MESISIQISNSTDKATLVAVWSEELDCYIGSDQRFPNLKRTGQTIGDIIDRLTEASANRIQGILEGPPH